MAVFTISIDTNFEEFWRYNYYVMVSVMRDGEQIELLKHSSEVAPVGAELKHEPLNYTEERGVVLKSQSADALTLYIYVVPHTLPSEQKTFFAPPFELRVKVKHGTRLVYNHGFEVNQWSGDNITLSI